MVLLFKVGFVPLDQRIQAGPGSRSHAGGAGNSLQHSNVPPFCAQTAAGWTFNTRRAQAEVELERDAGYRPGGLPPIVVFDRSSMIGEIWDEVTAP